MRKKFEVIIWRNKYIVWVPTVWLYWLSLVDIEQFIMELFLEFNKDVPILSDIQINNLLEEIFEVNDNIYEKILKEEEKWKTINGDNFHIIIGRFMLLYPSNDYHAVILMPFMIFQRLLKDYKKVTGEEDINDLKTSNEPDKQKLINLLSKIS